MLSGPQFPFLLSENGQSLPHPQLAMVESNDMVDEEGPLSVEQTSGDFQGLMSSSRFGTISSYITLGRLF